MKRVISRFGAKFLHQFIFHWGQKLDYFYIISYMKYMYSIQDFVHATGTDKNTDAWAMTLAPGHFCTGLKKGTKHNHNSSLVRYLWLLSPKKSIVIVPYIRNRATSPLTTGQFTAGISCWALRAAIWTYHILHCHRQITLYGRNLLEPVHDDFISLVTLSGGYFTWIAIWTAMYVVWTAHCL